MTVLFQPQFVLHWTECNVLSWERDEIWTVGYIFLQLVNKDSLGFTVKEWGVTIMKKQQTPSPPIFIL
jgi:hypothetical protein